MSDAIEICPPRTTDALREAFVQSDAAISALWNRIGPEEFFEAPSAGGWSPARNLSHLVLSTNIVTMALNLPRFLPAIVFGRATKPSRSYEEIRDRYVATLTAGAGAGPFTPRNRPIPSDPSVERDRLIAKWQKSVPTLVAAMDAWDDAALDRYRVLHPLIGRLTMREILCFTLYHNSRHANVVAGRLAAKNSQSRE